MSCRHVEHVRTGPRHPRSAGHAVAFYLFGGAALSATACRFESGYGRHPGGYANLISLVGRLQARLSMLLPEPDGDAG